MPGLLAPGLGLGVGLSSLTTAGVSAVQKSRPSLAGALVHMFQLGVGAPGLVIATSIFTYISKSGPGSSLGRHLRGCADECARVQRFLRRESVPIDKHRRGKEALVDIEIRGTIT